jgi:hypothetical protein
MLVQVSLLQARRWFWGRCCCHTFVCSSCCCRRLPRLGAGIGRTTACCCPLQRSRPWQPLSVGRHSWARHLPIQRVFCRRLLRHRPPTAPPLAAGAPCSGGCCWRGRCLRPCRCRRKSLTRLLLQKPQPAPLLQPRLHPLSQQLCEFDCVVQGAVLNKIILPPRDAAIWALALRYAWPFQGWDHASTAAAESQARHPGSALCCCALRGMPPTSKACCNQVGGCCDSLAECVPTGWKGVWLTEWPMTAGDGERGGPSFPSSISLLTSGGATSNAAGNGPLVI